MASRDELVAQLQALSLKKHMGQNVSAEVQQIINKAQSEDDKAHLQRLCRALGLQ